MGRIRFSREEEREGGNYYAFLERQHYQPDIYDRDMDVIESRRSAEARPTTGHCHRAACPCYAMVGEHLLTLVSTNGAGGGGAYCGETFLVTRLSTKNNSNLLL